LSSIGALIEQRKYTMMKPNEASVPYQPNVLVSDCPANAAQTMKLMIAPTVRAKNGV